MVRVDPVVGREITRKKLTGLKIRRMDLSYNLTKSCEDRLLVLDTETGPFDGYLGIAVVEGISFYS
jgi:hypothetical protein